MLIASASTTSASARRQAARLPTRAKHLTFSNSLSGKVLHCRSRVSVHRERLSIYAGRKAAKVANKKGKEVGTSCDLCIIYIYIKGVLTRCWREIERKKTLFSLYKLAGCQAFQTLWSVWEKNRDGCETRRR